MSVADVAMRGRHDAGGLGAGERVEQGQVVVIVESMKMEHPVRAPLTGTVAEILVRPGQQVETGAVLVVVTPDDETPAD